GSECQVIKKRVSAGRSQTCSPDWAIAHEQASSGELGLVVKWSLRNQPRDDLPEAITWGLRVACAQGFVRAGKLLDLLNVLDQIFGCLTGAGRGWPGDPVAGLF